MQTKCVTPVYYIFLYSYCCSLFQEILATLLLSIAVCHSPLEIKIVIIMSITTAPLSSKELGGTISVTTQISMACIFVAVTRPMLME